MTAVVTRTVVSLSSAPAVERVPANVAAITARMTDELSCKLPVTPGTELPSEMPISITVTVTNPIPIP